MDIKKWQWERHPKAEALVKRTLLEIASKISFLNDTIQGWENFASVKLVDCIDHFCLPHKNIREWEELGYEKSHEEGHLICYHHPGAMLPKLVLSKKKETHGVYVTVEEIEQFLMVHRKRAEIEGDPFSGYRRACVSKSKGSHFFLVERRGVLTYKPQSTSNRELSNYLACKALWKTRLRESHDEHELMQDTIKLAQKIVKKMGKGRAADLAFLGEREYWQSRNEAAQVQKNRQDAVGLGWANHDHHTFRSSREHFQGLIQVMKALGFHLRERFYAGNEAGWGAQVMEHSDCGLILFLDVDLEPQEIEIDFLSVPLKPLDHLGTVGLWCALHGESLLRAGMHHLEAQFDYQRLVNDLKVKGIETMNPFSDFEYLKQAFTKGQVWNVSPRRVQKIHDKGFITKEDATRFLEEGAIGSHLENLERKEGYKGFNQKNVSDIIARLDLRKKDFI